MRKTKRTSILFLSFISLMLPFFVNENSKENICEVKADSATYTSIKADVSKFKVLSKNTSLSSSFVIDEENEALIVNGSWDSAFAGTNQFDTLASSYYLKAHCYNALQGDSSDGVVGFNIYYDNITSLNFYLHWMSGNFSGSIAEATFLAHVNGADRNIYEYAILPRGTFAGNASPFLDCWTDSGQWTTGDNRDSGSKLNLRTAGSTIMLNKGFDMTLYVDRTTYNDRLVDVLQLQIDAYEIDGVTPKTYYTPKYAMDIFTCPKGVDSKFAQIKPQIGFWNYNVGEVTYSNIEFGSNRSNESISSNFEVVGETPTKAEVDNDDGTICYNNTNLNSGFYIAQNVELSSPRSDFQADFKGSNTNTKDTSVGYVFYYDEKNYLTFYFGWNGTLNTIDGLHIIATIDGSTDTKYKGATNPWSELKSLGYQETNGTKDLWSDDGFVSDAEYPCGLDNNFNNFRSESEINLLAGFTMGVSKRRTVYMSRIIDEYQLYITALGTDNLIHTWYSQLWCMDAFTYLNGSSEKSSLFDVEPKIGFYAFNTDEIAITNLKFNGVSLIAKDSSKLVFGSHQEGDWTLTGSDYGNNWKLNDNSLTESWDDLEIDSYIDQVTALKLNENKNYYMSGELSFSNLFGSSSYVSIYPYYFNNDNYLKVSLIKDSNNCNLIVNGKINGEYLGGVEYLAYSSIDFNINDDLLIEIGIIDNSIDIYLGETIRPTYTFTFARQKFEDRELNSAQSGFSFYNASGSIKNIVIGSESRINQFTPSDSDKPSIYQFGNRETSGYVGYVFTLPTFVAFNHLGESIDVIISISSEDGTYSKTLDKNVYDFTVDEIGIYTVNVTAEDEWGHSADEITYKINFSKYMGPNETEPKEILWQTIVVLSFFGVLILITIACGVILVRKNKKEALKAAELNKKNHQKHLFDDEDE